MNTVEVVTRCRCLPESSKEFMAAVKQFLGPTREEGGCISYEVLQDIQDPQNVVFHEKWKGMEGVNEHITSAHFAVFMDTALRLLEPVAGDAPFAVTIASPFNPQSPPEGSEVIVATMCRSLPGKSGDVCGEAPEVILNPSSEEPGCSLYQLYQGIEDQDSFLLYEVWKGFSAIQEHMGTKHFAQFMEKAPELFIPFDDGQLFSVHICTPYTG